MGTPRTLPGQWGLAAVAVLGFVVAATGELGTLGQWLALSILLVSVPPLLSPLRRPASLLLARLHAHPARFPIALCTLVFVWLFGELLLGHPPASRDHGIHFFQTAALVRDLVPHGYLHGWSPALNNGIAVGEHYPILGYLWTGAAYLLTGGAVGLRASYALGLFAVWATAAGGVFLLAHTLMSAIGRAGGSRRPRKVARAAAWAGCIAATLWFLDEGYSREGGWHYLMFHGVWPQLLSTALWTLSLPAALSAMRTPSPQRIAWAGLCLAGSILAHPFGLLTGATSMGLLPLAVWLTGKDRPMPTRLWGVWLLILAVVGALTAGWLVVFFDHASTLGRTPVPWETWSSLSSSLLTGELFHDQRAWVGPLAVVGILAAILRVAPVTWWIVGTTVALLLLGSQAAITVLRLDLVVSGFKNLQFIRYAIALKPLWYALAGTGAVVVATASRPLWRHLARQLRTSGGLQTRHRLALALLAGPVLWGGFHGISRVIARPVAGLHTLERSHHGADEAELHAILRREQQASDRPMRVAFLRQHMGGGLYPLFTLTDLGVPIVLDGHVPTVNSIYKVEHRRPVVFEALGVTHVVRDRPLPDREHALAEALTAVASAGPYTVERYTNSGERSHVLPGAFVWEAGNGTVFPESSTAQAWTWRLSGFDNDVHTIDSVWAPHPRFRWQFTPDGGQKAAQDLGYEPAALARGGLTGMRLRVRGNGLLSLTLARPEPHQWATWLSGLAFVLTLIGLVFARPWDVPTRLHSPRAQRLLAWSWVVIAVLAAVWIARRQHSLLARTWVSEQTFTHPRNFVRDLVDAGTYKVTRSPNTTCDGMLGRDSRRGCSEDDQATQVGMLYRKPYLYRCVQVTVPARGRAEIAFLDLGKAHVRGVVARDTGTGGRGSQIKWRTSGKAPFTTLGIKKHLFEAPAKAGRFVVEIENESLRDQKVCAAAAEVSAIAERSPVSPLP